MKTPLTFSDGLDLVIATEGATKAVLSRATRGAMVQLLLEVDIASRDQERQANEQAWLPILQSLHGIARGSDVDGRDEIETRCQSILGGEQCFLFGGHGDELDHRNGSSRWSTKGQDGPPPRDGVQVATSGSVDRSDTFATCGEVLIAVLKSPGEPR